MNPKLPKHEEELVRLSEETKIRDIEYERLCVEIAGLHKKLRVLETSQSRHEEEKEELSEARHELEASLKEFERQKNDIYSQLVATTNSTSWRLTAPLRASKLVARKVGNKLRTTSRLLLWIISHSPSASVQFLKGFFQLRRSQSFDTDYYLEENPDIAAAGINPIFHYLAYGADEGRNPCKSFNTYLYISENPNWRAFHINPLLLYLERRSSGGAIDGEATVPSGEEKEDTSTISGQVTERDFEEQQRIAVFTAIVGNYDELKEPEVVSPHCDYICFTDRPFEYEGIWEIRSINYFHAEPARISRYVKTHPHIFLKSYLWSIWIDANLLIHADLSELVSECAAEQGTPLTLFIHPHRRCIYNEARECLKRGLDTKAIVNPQMELYRSEGLPVRYGLSETNVIVFKHDHQSLKKLLDEWWAQIDSHSHRDQLSLNYVAYKNRIELGELAPRGVSVRNDPRFTRFKHKDESEYVPRYKAVYAETVAPTGVQNNEIQKNDSTRATDLSDISVDLAICVHNGFEDVKRCLASVEIHRLPHQRTILVDDGSDPETEFLLRSFVKTHPEDVLIRHIDAGGYTKAANAAVEASSADYVVLLNSDTIVSESWIEKLIRCAESAEDIGIVGPMSNAASWQSLPIVKTDEGDFAVNDLPHGISVDEMSRLCETHSGAIMPRVPLVNGFCFLIKRSVINTIGGFDEHAFPNGYGEENDFCFRATDAGFACAIATDVYIYHAKSRSYSQLRRQLLSQRSSKIFRGKYSDVRVRRAIQTMQDQPMLADVRASLEAHFGAAADVATLNGSDAPPAEPKEQDIQTKTKVRPTSSLELEEQNLLLKWDLSAEELARNRDVIEGFRQSPHVDPKTILWFLPSFDHVYRGGIHTIIRVAEAFSKFEGTKNIFVIYGRTKKPINELETAIKEAFPDIDFELIELKRDSQFEGLPPSDVAFCTLWTSAYLLARYNKCKAKFYFLQDFEPAFYAAGTVYGLIEQTYRLGFCGIANTPGVAERYRAYNPWVSYFIPAVDRSIYYPDPAAIADDPPFRVVFYGRPTNSRNGFRLGTEALRQVKAKFGDQVEIISAGAIFSPADYGLVGVIENYGVLATLEDVAALYRSAHVGLVFMFTGHPSYQPFEYMASGCVTVTNKNPYTTWLLKDNQNALLADSTTTCIAERVIEALRSPNLRAKVIEGGLRTVEELDWEDSIARIRAFTKNPHPASENFLSEF